MRDSKTMSAMVVLLMGLSVSAADPPTSPIRLPVVQQELPKPMPADAAVTLSPDVSYVIESDSECLLFPSPGGAISITREAGPVKLRGVFIGGSGKKEWKKFDAKFVYVVDAVKDGRDELIIVPVGAKSETDAKRVTFQVGKMPKPPPDIDPKPDDPKPVPVTSFRVILIHESAQNLPPAQNSILYGKDVRDYLTAKTTPESGVAGWRLYDKDTDAANDQSAIAAMWKAVKPKVTTVPAMAVEANGKVEIVPLPATAAEALTALKKYRGE